MNKPVSSVPHALWFAIGLVLVAVFRLGFGLSSQFWFPDERQIYLLGLKFFCVGGWPFFGPDVVYTSSQIPGALQSLLVGIPLCLAPVPEAPFILLNILSFASLLILGIYLLRLLPELPAGLVVFWVLTCPWVLNFSTHVVNPSYVLPAAVLFFIAFLELSPAGTGWMKPRTAFGLMGFCFFWIFQLHMSWVLLGPFIAAAFWFRFRTGLRNAFSGLFWFLLGSLPMLLLVVPTYLKYGLTGGSGGTGGNIRFLAGGMKEYAELFFTVIARYFSFASFEITRFLGSSTPLRLEFLRTWWWSAPFVVFAGLVGAAQVLWMIVRLFFPFTDPKERFLRVLTIAAVLLVAASFLFSVKGPSSHAFYLAFPLAMAWFFVSVRPLLKMKLWRWLFVCLIVSGILVHTAIGLRNLGTVSLYRDRQKVVSAIAKKDYSILGQRRKTASGIGY